MIDIKSLREQKGLTQKELAERCNVTLRTVQNWEQGKHIPESALILLELLDFPVREGEMINPSVKQIPNGDNNAQIAENNNHVNLSSTLDKAINEIAGMRLLLAESVRSTNDLSQRLMTLLEKSK